MGYLVLVRVLNAADDLLEDLARLYFRKLLSPCNKVKKFAACRVLQDHEDLELRVDKFKKFDGVRVVEPTQNFEFPLDLLEDTVLSDLLLVEDLDGHLVTCLFVEGHLHFSK